MWLNKKNVPIENFNFFCCQNYKYSVYIENDVNRAEKKNKSNIIKFHQSIGDTVSVTIFLDDWFDSAVNGVPICPSSWRISLIEDVVVVSAYFLRIPLPTISPLSLFPCSTSHSVDVSPPKSASTSKDICRM